MSKKHFQALVDELKNLKPGGENKYASPKLKHIAEGKLLQWVEMVKGVASVCSKFNSQFDRQRFLTACGVE